jgi:phosphoglucosamine mutase
MQAIKESGKPLEKLFDASLFPQCGKSVKVQDKNAVIGDENLQKIIRKIEENLGANERILVRASGTENKVRILVEGMNESENNERLSLLENAILSAIGSGAKTAKTLF